MGPEGFEFICYLRIELGLWGWVNGLGGSFDVEFPNDSDIYYLKTQSLNLHFLFLY